MDYRPARVLHNHADSSFVTSLDFSDTGHWCISSGTDESIQVYDCKQGTHAKTVLSKKYGCALARFTHHSTNCVYASTKEQDTIRYLSLHDNTYVRYFKGHKNRVTGLEISPVNDTLISTALDRSVRIWDLKSPNCQGLISVPTPAQIAFDATGMVIAIASQDLRIVALYDVRNFDKEPFLKFNASAVDSNWQKVEFSNDGKWVVLGGDGNSHGIFDAFNGKNVASARGHLPLQRPVPSTSPVAFTVDGKYLFGGSNDDSVCVWDMTSVSRDDDNKILNPAKQLEAQQIPSLLAFNPKSELLATANQSVSFWLPNASM